MTTAQKLAPCLGRWVALVFGGCLACASEQDPSVQPADAPVVITAGADRGGTERPTAQPTTPPSTPPTTPSVVITAGADRGGTERPTAQTTPPPSTPPTTPSRAALRRLIRAAEQRRLHPANTHFNLHGDHRPGLIRDIVRTCRRESAAPKIICRYRGCGRRCFNETIVVELTRSASGWKVSSFDVDWDDNSHNCGICY